MDNKRYMVVAIKTNGDGGAGAAAGATHAWGFTNIALKEEGWVEIDAGFARSLEKNEWKAIRLMASADACAVRDAARKFDLSNDMITIVPVVG